MNAIHTIGHSNHAIEVFIALLHRHHVSAIADVRSHPASRRFPQFDKKALQASLEAAGIHYQFFGDRLGARPRDTGLYAGGRADFDRIRASNQFVDALARLKHRADENRLCLMCAERDPAECHRTWLVAQPLHDSGASVVHILADGAVETHQSLLRRIAGVDSGTSSLFGDDADVLTAAARREARRVAYSPHTNEADEGIE